MPEIKCPNCGKIFTVDESGYAAIAKRTNATYPPPEMNCNISPTESLHMLLCEN